jgi:hypothetical protein
MLGEIQQRVVTGPAMHELIVRDGQRGELQRGAASPSLHSEEMMP